MRIDLAAERGQARFNQPVLLLFQFLLVAIAVPYLNGESGGEKRRCVNGPGHPRPGVSPLLLKRKDAMASEAPGDKRAQEFGKQDRGRTSQAEQRQTQLPLPD